MRRRLITAALASSALSMAAGATGLSDCRAIKDDAKRLACYDALANAGQPGEPVVSAAPRAAAAATPDTAAPSADARFGSESIQSSANEKPADTIESRLLGHFDHWQPRMRFTLENGQVWLCLAERRENFNAVDNPAVVIKRNFAGHYYLRIGGVYKPVAVRRIQ